MWVIYDRPRDMPEHVVARRHVALPGGHGGPTDDVLIGDSVAAVRKLLPPGLHRMARYPADEPQIVEVWL